MTQFINKKGPADHTYTARFMAGTVVIYARSLHEARQRAIEYFKPKKRAIDLLPVNLHSLGEGRTLVEQEAQA